MGEIVWESDDKAYYVSYSNVNGNELYQLVDAINVKSCGLTPDLEGAIRNYVKRAEREQRPKMNARELQGLAAAATTLRLHGYAELADRINAIAGMPREED